MCENFIIYYFGFKALYSTKSLSIIFDKVDGYIRKYNRTKYVAFLCSVAEVARIFW